MDHSWCEQEHSQCYEDHSQCDNNKAHCGEDELWVLRTGDFPLDAGMKGFGGRHGVLRDGGPAEIKDCPSLSIGQIAWQRTWLLRIMDVDLVELELTPYLLALLRGAYAPFAFGYGSQLGSPAIGLDQVITTF